MFALVVKHGEFPLISFEKIQPHDCLHFFKFVKHYIKNLQNKMDIDLTLITIKRIVVAKIKHFLR